MNDLRPAFSFVVPLFNTGDSRAALLDAFRGLTIEERWEIVFVDDGSTDGTPAAMVSGMAGMHNATLVELARNYGEHAAVLEGLRHARGAVMVTMDDDLQNPLAEAVRLARHLRESAADVVFGLYACKQHHWLRNLGSRAVNGLATLLLGKPAHLYLSSFRAMKRDLVARVIEYRGPYPHIDGLILSATNRFEQIEVEHVARQAGGSGYTAGKLAHLAMNLCFDFSIVPLRIASVLGVGLCGAGAMLLGQVVIEWLFVGRVQAGWGSLMGALAVFSGAQLLMLGLIGEYVGRAFLTVSGKPQSHRRAVRQFVEANAA